MCATSHRRRYGPAYASIVFTRLEGCAPGLGCRESAEVVTLASILKAIRSEPGRGAAVRHVQAFDDPGAGGIRHLEVRVFSCRPERTLTRRDEPSSRSTR